MPVVVVGADEPLGRRVVDLLLAAPGAYDLRATVDDRAAVGDLVQRGVKTAVADFFDLERFGAVLEAAHTVIHVRGGAGALGGELVAADADVPTRRDGGVADVLSAAEDTGVRRIVTLAPAGDLAPHETEALAALHASDYDSVVFRIPSDVDADLLARAVVAADQVRDLHGHVEVDGSEPAQLVAAVEAWESGR